MCGPLDLQGERMKIDLSKKPEGATHINPHSGLWVKCFGGNSGSYQFFKDGEWEMGFGCMSNSYLEIAQPEPWNGEGLPPVGTVCELHRDTYFEIEWQAVALLGIGQTKAFFRDKEGHEWSRPLSELSFRPIRTPEQIAAEERETAILAMRADIGWIAPYLGPCPVALLYDAGYRKQVSE